MRKKKSVIAFVLMITMLVAYIPISSMATQVDGFEKQQERTVTETWEQKISEEVWEKLESAEATEKIPVWIWFTDINHQEVEKQVQEKTGLSAATLAVPFDSVPNEFKRELQEECAKEDSERQDGIIEEALSDYIRETDVQRTEEYDRTKAYIKEKRATARSEYMEKNRIAVEKLDLPSEEIIFQSELTPSVIVRLTKEQIEDVAKDTDVMSVDYYDDSECDSVQSNSDDLASIRGDEIYECSGLNGAGVNVLVADRLVRAGQSYYDELYRENIWLVFDKAAYPLDSISEFPESTESSLHHGNYVVSRLQTCVRDVNIYSVDSESYADIEWALNELDINIINVCVGYTENSTLTKWYDAIVNTYNVTLIVSAGNFRSEEKPNVISPADGYNSIAVTSCSYAKSSEQFKLRDYRYNPISSEELVNYKPEIAVTGIDTSGSAPFASGIVAMMIQLKPSLSTNPELIKAILMASCHEKAAPFDANDLQESMEDGLTQKQGAGVVDAYRAVCIVALGQYGVRTISTGSEDIDIGEVGTEYENVNVSIAWLRNNTYTQGNYTSSTLGTLQELELRVLENDQVVKTSAKTNAGKQMVYFPTTGEDCTIRVTKASQNTEPVRYAYAWSTEDVTFDLNLTASATDLSFNNGAFTYSTIQFSENQGLYNNRNMYVIIKKHSDSDVVYTSPVYTVDMNGFSVGVLADMEASARSYLESEYMEILMYSSSNCTDKTLISRQFFCPTLFDLTDW